MIKSFEVPSNNKLNNVQLSAHSYIKFSNNVSALNVVSTLQDIPFNQQQSTSLNGYVGHFDKSQLTKFTAGSNVRIIMASCFIDCYNMTDASFKGHIDSIGDYAFYGCSKLNNVSLLKSGHTANSIGDYAFASTGLQKVQFDAQNDSSFQPYLGKCIFADCEDLKKIEFSHQNIIAEQMFLNCTSLTSVSFAKSTALVSQNAFENCVSLQRMSLPVDIYNIPDGFMKGCINLTSFSFTEPGNLAYNQSLGNSILDGTAITSITFPATVSSFSSFSTNTLYGMNDLKEIHFNGMTYEQLTSAILHDPDIPEDAPPQDEQWRVEIRYETTKIYCEQCFEKKMKKHAFSQDEINEYFIMKSANELCKIAKDCYDSNIPVLCFTSQSGETCHFCNDFMDYILKNDVFRAFLKDNDKCVILYGDDFPVKFYDYTQHSTRYLSLCGISGNNWGTYVIKTMLWKKSNGVVVRKYTNNGFPRLYSGTYANYIQKYIIDELNEFTATFNSESTGIITAVTTVVNTMITQTNCFGLNHDVQIFSKDGKCIEFTGDNSGGIVMYNQQVQVDNITDNDFRYGQWYSKAQLLKRYADMNHIPVLAIAAQNENFKQSQIFNNIVFNNDGFQQYITSKSILLCKVDSSSFSSGNASYLLRTWMDKPSFQRFPLMMMYWVNKDGAITIPDASNPQIVSYDDVMTDFAYFSNDNSDSRIDDVGCVHSSDELISWIENLTEYSAYVPQSKFERPAISEFLSQYPKYKKYQNQLNDDYGRYYPVKTLMPKSSASYTVKVNNASNAATKYTISPQSQPVSLPPAGTYQYFSLLSTDDNASFYDSIYQISGLIFKVGNEELAKMINESSFSYGSMTFNAYLNSIGVESDKIEKIASYFRDDIYIVTTSDQFNSSILRMEDDDDYTIEIDPDEIHSGTSLWNDFKTLTLRSDTIVHGETAHEIKLWLSSPPTIHEDPDDPDDKELMPTIPQYVISAQVLGVEYSSMKLLWAREFNNA